MRHRMRALAVVGGLASLFVLAAAPAAFAHAQRQDGPIHLEIGFGTEPAYAGQPNSVQVILTEHGQPVVSGANDLKATISFGGQQETQPLEPNFEVGGDGQPGDYRAWFIPSQPGPYTFHITGTVKGTKIDESVTGGPTTFSVVTDPAEAMFPAVNTPTNAQLASRIDQDAARLDAATSAANDAKSAADSSRTVAVLGMLVGAAGLIVAVVALMAARKRGAPAASSPAPEPTAVQG
ncbi:MAG TPA: hypothetical protein VK646_09625 [Actinomycetota bacterium]|nr:hypothetical protein [Actinomycetota bacterium]